MYAVAHMLMIARAIGEVIAQGAAHGEFEAPDVPLASLCTCTAMMRSPSADDRAMRHQAGPDRSIR